MKLINDYNDYIIDILLEKAKNAELSLVLSKRLKELLLDIDHDIAYELLGIESNSDERFPITLIDIDDDENINNFDKLSFVQSNKVHDDIVKQKISLGLEEPTIDQSNQLLISRPTAVFGLVTKNRTMTTIGRTINKLFPNKYPNAGKPNSIESFVDKVKAERTKHLSVFKLVEGEDIIKYYHFSNYDSDAIEGTSLGSSCMRYDKCSKYIEFYVRNNVKMLILMSNKDEDKIIGRAIVWPKVVVDGEVDRIFMDRIYTVYSSDVDKFKKYATEKDWLYKTNQNRDPEEYIFDPKTNDSNRLTMVITDVIKTDAFPYLDTIKFLDIRNNILTNDESSRYYKLESTRGGYFYDNDSYIYNSRSNEIEREDQDDDIDDDEHDGETWSDMEEQWINDDDAVYSEYLGSWASVWYANNHWSYCDIENDYIPNEDVVEVGRPGGDYVSIRYARYHYRYSDMDEKWYYPDDVVSSSKQGWINKDDAIEVYIDMERKKYDWRVDDNDYITYINEDGDDEYYDEDILGEYFVRVYSDMNGRMIELKKEDDNDKYFYYQGNFYLNNLKDEVTGQKTIGI